MLPSEDSPRPTKRRRPSSAQKKIEMVRKMAQNLDISAKDIVLWAQAMRQILGDLIEELEVPEVECGPERSKE